MVNWPWRMPEELIVEMEDALPWPEPQPGDGPEYWNDLAYWKAAHPE